MKRTIKISVIVLASALPLAAQDARAQERQPSQPRDPFIELLFPPELVMQHQNEINLQEFQRNALHTAMQQAQAKFMDAQWKLSAEGEKLQRLLQAVVPDEAQVLEQVDRVLALEREVKRVQMSLMIRIKSTLTPAQQAKLRELRTSREE